MIHLVPILLYEVNCVNQLGACAIFRLLPSRSYVNCKLIDAECKMT